MAGTHPSAQAILDLFDFTPVAGHYQLQVQRIRDTYKQLAEWLVEFTPSGPEQTVALRKLMESKDAAVRALIAEAQTQAKRNFNQEEASNASGR